MELDIIYQEDCFETFKGIEDKSIDLLVVDPPYNIHKAEWDRIPNYIEWCGKWLVECQRVLKDNGSFYFFHNDMPVIAELMIWIKANTKFIFKQFIVWNKRFDDVPNKGFLDGFIVPEGLRNYQQMAEYCLYYTFQDETGLTRIFGNDGCFLPIREYLRKEKIRAGLRTCKQINQLLGVDDNGGGMASHYFSNKIGFKQWALPTKEMYAKLQSTGYFQREYEDLRLEYEDLRYTFNLQGNDRNIIQMSSGNNGKYHPTQKPITLIENIVKHSSNEGDTVLDCFAGSGTTGVACQNLNRNYILIEKDPKYYEIILKRLE